MFSMKAKYAVKAVLAIAEKGRHGPVQSMVLARTQNIPRKFLETILLELKNDGILESRRGKGGGYILASDPASLSIGQIIRLVDGPLVLPTCVAKSTARGCEVCEESPSCGLRLVILQVGAQLETCLDHMTLAGLLSQTESNPSRKGSLVFQI
jgi:Rrf2 family protein